MYLVYQSSSKYTINAVSAAPCRYMTGILTTNVSLERLPVARTRLIDSFACRLTLAYEVHLLPISSKYIARMLEDDQNEQNNNLGGCAIWKRDLRRASWPWRANV